MSTKIGQLLSKLFISEERETRLLKENYSYTNKGFSFLSDTNSDLSDNLEKEKYSELEKNSALDLITGKPKKSLLVKNGDAIKITPKLHSSSETAQHQFFEKTEDILCFYKHSNTFPQSLVAEQLDMSEKTDVDDKNPNHKSDDKFQLNPELKKVNERVAKILKVTKNYNHRSHILAQASKIDVGANENTSKNGATSPILDDTAMEITKQEGMY